MELEHKKQILINSCECWKLSRDGVMDICNACEQLITIMEDDILYRRVLDEDFYIYEDELSSV